MKILISLFFFFMIFNTGLSAQSLDSSVVKSAPDGKQRFSEAQVKKMQEARKHIMQDRTSAHPDRYKAAEELYQKGSKSMGSGDAEKLLSQVVAEYPELNRAGCAQLYLAKMAEGEKQKELLKTAIDKFHNCWYGDGVQVGPYALFYLGINYLSSSNEKEAKKIFQKLKSDYPDAIDHSGILLSSMLPE